ncbi:hypothetical protein LCGC14_0420140 [marine sediment metagenome]|uniref:Uncharacterized protein n=1 Tax=marine sediment metagenome TaxID=412755 RepID=A0A0F9SQW0_9ZZZZ
MIADTLVVIFSSLTLLVAIIGVGWRVGFLLGKLTQEVKGHNKRLDDMQKEIKSIQIDRQHRE